MVLILLLVTIILTVIIVRTGHKAAVAKSEASLRAKFDSGEYSQEARKLMKEAGYNV